MSAASEFAAPVAAALTPAAAGSGSAPDLLAALDPRARAELIHVRSRVREQLGDLLDTLDEHGGVYADHFAEQLITGRCRGRGHTSNGTLVPPSPLAGPLAGIVRELVRDEVTAVQLYGVPGRRAA